MSDWMGAEPEGHRLRPEEVTEEMMQQWAGEVAAMMSDEDRAAIASDLGRLRQETDERRHAVLYAMRILRETNPSPAALSEIERIEAEWQ